MAERLAERGQKLYMDFGFLCSSTEDYSSPNADKDHVLTSRSLEPEPQLEREVASPRKDVVVCGSEAEAGDGGIEAVVGRVDLAPLVFVFEGLAVRIRLI